MGTKEPVTHTINGTKVEFDGDTYRLAKDLGEFENQLFLAVELIRSNGLKQVRVEHEQDGDLVRFYIR